VTVRAWTGPVCDRHLEFLLRLADTQIPAARRHRWHPGREGHGNGWGSGWRVRVINHI